jgi:NAD(P)-dependent dehydrogenase (short-subunit alcohol dehydrogenase family)
MDGYEVLAQRLDVTQQRDVDALAAEIRETWGHLDVPVNDATIHYDTWESASGADLEIVREALETNLFGA